MTYTDIYTVNIARRYPGGVEVIDSIRLLVLWWFLLQVACCNEMSDLANLSFPFQGY
jgi:hypothetical protein